MTVLATIIVLGVLIFIHELGHFLAAKSVDIEVQRFSIGLGPRIWGVQKGETEYVLSAIPLGGYVKMGGMDDEIMDRVEGGPAENVRTPGPRDFDSKPVWARAWVISAGVIMNMLFALIVYIASAALWGVATADTTRVGRVVESVLPEGTEALATIESGSHLVSVGGEPAEDWGALERGIIEGDPGPLTIELSDPTSTVDITVPVAEEDRARAYLAVQYWLDPVAAYITPGSPADDGGVEAGDVLLSVAGTDVARWDQFVDQIEARPGEQVELTLERDGGELTRVVTLDSVTETDPATGEERPVGKVGIQVQGAPVLYSSVGLVDATRIGWRRTVFTTGMILAFVRDLFTGGVSPRSLGSIITIGQASGQAASMGMDMFLGFMALFSINLAVLNLLPIPILDGGHLVFLAIEAVRGRALSVEQRMRWSQVGLIVILGIMVLALSNDILRLFGM